MILKKTRSLCPECLQNLPAVLRQEGDRVLLERTCPEHGTFAATVWRGEPSLASWSRPKTPPGKGSVQTVTRDGCPKDCGRCPEHKQHPCTVLLEITRDCNLSCPVCFASSGSGQGGATPLETLRENLAWIRKEAGPVVLQVSGGEPTCHPELAGVIRAARELFPAVQLNTNGLLLAENAALAGELASAGLSWVFLQFDGMDDGIYRALRGRDLLAKKLAAVENCAKAGLGVVLVPTLARGVNDGDLGNILEFALSRVPHVRGIHVQPMTRSGRNMLPESEPVTLPEILRLLETQSKGRIRPEHATPPGCEHERCSFHCRYTLDRQGNLHPLAQAVCCTTGNYAEPVETTGGCCCDGDGPAEGGAEKAIASVIRNWQSAAQEEEEGDDAFSRFINSARRTFSVTCMAFQDVWTADGERLQGCCVHVFDPRKRLMPFCSFNLTDARGRALHRRNGFA